MDPEKNIENQLEQLAKAIPSGNSFVDGVMNRIETSSDNLQKQPIHISFIRRLFMKTSVKFAAAAIVLIAAFLSLTLCEKTITRAYALEQTIKAYKGLRYVHIKDFREGQTVPLEFWVELDQQEQVKRFRAAIPAWAEREGPMVVVWKEGILQIKKDDVLATKQNDSLGQEILNMAKGCDPRTVVKELHQLEAEGKVEITTSQPPLKSEPVVLTAKSRRQSNDAEQITLFVDQDTKLVIRAVINKPENGYHHSWEYSDYNIAIDESLFILQIPAEFVKDIDARLISLDINKSSSADVVAVFGRPQFYRFHDKFLEENNLPEAYCMHYPGGFIVSIYKNYIMLWGCQQLSEDEIPKYTLMDSIHIGTAIDDVFKILGHPVKVVEGFGTENNKIMYEDNSGYADMNINERKGFCFSQYDNYGKEIKVYFEDNVFYKDKEAGYYGTASKGKRVRFVFMNNKVAALYEYRTEPVKTTE